MALTLHGITFIAMNRCAVEKLNMFTKLSTHIRIYLLILRRCLNGYFAFLLLKNVPWSIKWTLGTYLAISIDKWTQSVIPKKERLYTSHLHPQPVFLSVPQLIYHDSSSRYRLLLLLSRDICLNPGPFLNLQPLYHD